MSNEKQLMVKMVLDLWNQRIKATDEKFNSLTDEQLQMEVAPGRNRAIYLLGHLTAVHDHMLPLLGFEPQNYSNLDEAFIKKADKEVKEIPSANELRKQWKDVNAKLATHFNKLTPEEWFQKHTMVSAEDFAKEPHRNRLNVVNGRIAHLQSHLGQLNLIKTK
jgi:hypothetical protein